MCTEEPDPMSVRQWDTLEGTRLSLLGATGKKQESQRECLRGVGGIDFGQRVSGAKGLQKAEVSCAGQQVQYFGWG
jgi:hypothetical protein